MSHMLIEAQEAPERVKEFLHGDKSLYSDLGRRLRELDPSAVGTIARGSSDHVANYAMYLVPQATGRMVASIPPSVVTVLKSPLNVKNQFILSISQSGGSPDLINAVESVRKSGALTAALVNDTTSVLAKTAEVLLPQRAGVEKGLAATKTVLCSMAAIARLVGEWSGDTKLLNALDQLPDVLFKAFALGMEIDDRMLEGISNAFILSRAYGLCAAQETALKIKETCGIHSEAFSTAEVRHGPREIVNERFMVIALALPGVGEKDVVDAALEMKAQGARVLLIGPESIKVDTVPFFALPRTDDPRLSPIVALQLLYPWLARASKALGRDPDNPKHLKSKVIKTM